MRMGNGAVKRTKIAKKAKRAGGKTAKPRKAAATSQAPEAPGAATPQAGIAAEPVLLSGGNPHIAKGFGDAPVQAFIAAMPDWKRDLGRRIDALIERTVPGVRKA